MKRIRATHVSSWMDEIGCGVLFSRGEDSDDEYLLIQRNFEEPDDGRPDIETDDEDFCGHFSRVIGALTRSGLEISYRSKTVAVSFVASDECFREAAAVLRVLLPGITPSA